MTVGAIPIVFAILLILAIGSHGILKMDEDEIKWPHIIYVQH